MSLITPILQLHKVNIKLPSHFLKKSGEYNKSPTKSRTSFI